MSNDNILPFLDVEVVGDTLEISTRPGVTLDPVTAIEYQLTASDLRRAELQGVGDMECDGLDTRQIALEIMATEVVDSAFEVGEADILVNKQPFHLMKHRRVGEIGIAAVHSSRGNDPKRWLLVLHDPNLHR